MPKFLRYFSLSLFGVLAFILLLLFMLGLAKPSEAVFSISQLLNHLFTSLIICGTLYLVGYGLGRLDEIQKDIHTIAIKDQTKPELSQNDTKFQS